MFEFLISFYFSRPAEYCRAKQAFSEKYQKYAPFGKVFPLAMWAMGTSLVHKDMNDYISLLVYIYIIIIYYFIYFIYRFA